MHYIPMTYFITGSLYILVPLNSCCPPPACPQPLETTILFSVSMRLVGFVCLFLTQTISEILQYLSSSVDLISLRIMPPWPIHIVTSGKISFFFQQLYSILLHVYATFSLAIHPLAGILVVSTSWIF